MTTKKLIEVALPLEKINAESAREKSIRHGHPSTLHLWWARRPLAAARAVIWASLVDDPSSHPEIFPTEDAQRIERKRLFDILEKLVSWDNLHNASLLAEAREEIKHSCNGKIPALLDPFAGGGTIPMEAQRLGLESHAHDLNPVAVMINKASIEIPSVFSGQPPVNPHSQRKMGKEMGIGGCEGLIEDVNYYGERIKKIAFDRIGHLYPKVKIPKEQGKGETNVVAWIWARTVKCPNPVCGCEMPLAKGFTLSKKKGNEAYVEPILDNELKKIKYTVRLGGSKPQNEPKLARGANFKCIMCGEITTPEYIKEEALAGRMGSTMIGIVAEGTRRRIFISPSEEQIEAARVSKPEDYPTGQLSEDRRALWTPLYGLDTFDKLFSNRQLITMTTLSELVKEIQTEIEADAVTAGLKNDHIPLSQGGNGAKAYSQAVAVYLAFAVDREANYCSTQNGWSGDFIIQVFGRQGIPMVWDYAESNPFSESTGNFSGAVKWVADAMSCFSTNAKGIAKQYDAQQDCGLRDLVVSTDPPYYDNIGYADLSDYFYISVRKLPCKTSVKVIQGDGTRFEFPKNSVLFTELPYYDNVGYADLSDYFYVWMRRCLKDVFPDLFEKVVTSKEELTSIPEHYGGDGKAAKETYEEGIRRLCSNFAKGSSKEYPSLIFFEFGKADELAMSAEVSEEQGLSAWENLLDALIQAGFHITAVFPVRTEKPNDHYETVRVCVVFRKRKEDAPQTTRRGFVNELKKALPGLLKERFQVEMDDWDRPITGMGCGISFFSQYKKVINADGTNMNVHDALQVIWTGVTEYIQELESQEGSSEIKEVSHAGEL